MKKSILFILFLLFTTLVMQAQPERGKFNPEEFRANLEEFITKKADFSNTEAQAFFPIFHKMKEEQRTLQKEIFKLKKNKPEDCNISEKDYANKIQLICELNTKMAQVQESYYKKMYKEVPAQKVYKAMLAEDIFHRMMLRQMNQRRRDNHHKK